MDNQNAPPLIPGLRLLNAPPPQPVPIQQPVSTEQAAASFEETKPSDNGAQNTFPAQGITENLPNSSDIQTSANLAQEPKDRSPSQSPSLISALEARLEALSPGKTKSQSMDESAAREPDVANSAVEGQNGADTTMMDAPTGEAEFEADSSPYESSSDDSSDDSSSSEDSDDGDAYPLLTPAEQARILMQDDGGSDDEGAKKPSGGPLRTRNEKAEEEVILKPDVKVTPEMKITELGTVQSIVENVAVIKANVSGEYQVLEVTSVLCLEDRSVIGAVSDTLGPVHQPLYTVHFTNATEIAAAGVAVGTKIFYVDEHSTFVFTQALKAKKGTDASNLYDEEVGDDEIEFSDDEKELEHKRRVKQQKLERRNGNNDGESSRGGRRPFKRRQEGSNANENTGMSYDDDMDGPYKPLARPASFADNVMRPEAPQENQSGRYRPNLGAQNTGRGRGRDDRARGHGRGRGSDRGGRSGGGGYQDRHKDNRGGYSLPPRPQTNTSQAPYYPQNQNNYGYNPQAHQQSYQPPNWPQPPYPSGPLSSPSPQLAFQGMQQQSQWPQMPMPPGVAGIPQLPGGVFAGAFFNPAFFGGQAPNQNPNSNNQNQNQNSNPNQTQNQTQNQGQNSNS